MGNRRNESTETWQFFLKSFYENVCPLEWKEACQVPEDKPINLTVITDRQKGLSTTVTDFKPDYIEIWHYHCTQHLAENVRVMEI